MRKSIGPEYGYYVSRRAFMRQSLDERRHASRDNMVVMRTGTETEMLAAFGFDYEAALKEGWQIEGSH